MTTTALALAHRVLALGREPLPPSTREAALRCVLDLAGAAAAGVAQPGVRAVREVARGHHGAGACSVWFTPERHTAAGAVFANAAAAAALDLDDGVRQARGHAGAAAIAAAWAALEQGGRAASAEGFLAAVAAGVEAGVRLSIGRLAYAPSGAWSAHAVIGAAGSWRGVSPQVMAHAFAIAAQTAPGLPGLAGLMGSDVKEGIASGALAGQLALDLAQAGFTGPQHILDDPALFDADRMLRTPAATPSPWIESTYFKPYACCRHIHAALDAGLALARQHLLRVQDLQEVQVHTYSATFNLANRPAPRDLVDAQYSVPYCVALGLLKGPQALLPMDPADLADTEVLEFAQRVSVHRDATLDAMFPARSPARVVMHTPAGTLESPVTDPRGDPITALTWAELQDKFRTSTRHTLGPERQEAVLQGVDRLREGFTQPLAAALHGTDGMSSSYG